MNPFLLTDGYKTGHAWMYPDETSLVYSNGTPRSNRYAPPGCDKLVTVGAQFTARYIFEMFDKDFFKQDKDRVCQEVKEEYSMYLNTDYDVSKIEELWDLGYLPVHIKALPEGTLVPMGVPVFTIYNTKKEFYWLTNFLETLLSNLLWKPMTSATIAFAYKNNLMEWARKTDEKSVGFVDFQGHDFSMRGMDSPLASMSSGFGHATSFSGSDSLPVIHFARKYYGAKGFVVGSVNATEHSVMCAGGKETEIETFRRLMRTFPTGILSVVSDTWNLWDVLTKYLPELKDEILARDGKLVIRPDSGDPVDIVCGTLNQAIDFGDTVTTMDHLKEYAADTILDAVRDETPHGELGVEKYNLLFKFQDKYYDISVDNIQWNRHDKQYYYIDMWEDPKVTVTEFDIKPYHKGVIELLWDEFGGTINEQGYKVLDPHIGAIYGDSITLERADEICRRLEAKGFASTNVVLGIGSFTYQFNTRDTFGFAMKATYVEIHGECKNVTEDEGNMGHPTTCPNCNCVERREIFKDPITDDGTKKSAKGLLMVQQNDFTGEYELVDQVTWEQEATGCLQTIFKDGEFYNETTLDEIRERLNQYRPQLETV